LAQSRKKKILEEVQRKRRQRTLATVTIVAILVAVIVVALFFIPRPGPNQVPLPAYLDHCVGGLLYHSHPNLVVTINGQGVVIPVTFDAGCPQPIHTHDSTGVLHIETDQDRNYTLGDWFLLWGHFDNDKTRAIFNSTQIFNNRVDATHHITMTVNGVGNTIDYQNLVFPRNAGTSSTCAVAGGACQPFDVVITYG